MMKVYDMVTYTLCGSEVDDRIPPAATSRHAELPQTQAGLQLIEAQPMQRAAELHPTLRHTDIETFLDALER